MAALYRVRRFLRNERAGIDSIVLRVHDTFAEGVADLASCAPSSDDGPLWGGHELETVVGPEVSDGSQ